MTTSSDAIGTILDGRYRLVALLGSGPTSSTYLGEDLSLQRQVAVRVAHPDFANDPEFRQRFAAEARAIAGLNHPSILRVYDWSEEPTGAFVVLEYVPGGSLRTILNERGALSLSQVVAVGSQAARALASAHASGITHGAVKPGNLLFDEDDRVRLTDFRPSEAAYDPFAAGAELDAERAKYASPEEALGSPLDARADVY
ncbi:MAG: serine/threonine-protein kinase, partial [Actinomycetota bacterium]